MRISMSSLGNFIPSKFSLTPVIANEFIPLIAMNSMNSITNKGDNLQYYSKPSFEHIIKKLFIKNKCGWVSKCRYQFSFFNSTTVQFYTKGVYGIVR